MERWEEHLINVLISKEIGERFDLDKIAIFEPGSNNYIFMYMLEFIGVVKHDLYDLHSYKHYNFFQKIKYISKNITYKKLENLTQKNDWMSWFIDTDTYFDRE